MRIPRFFYAGPLAANTVITLSETASHHLLHVLRLPPQQEIIVFNSAGGEYLAQVVDSHKKLARVIVNTFCERQNESPLFIELGQAISRREKMDYAIQKAVELGVSRIVPLITERCAVKFKADRKDNRLTHWQGIVIGACEQSGRCYLPELVEPVLLTEWLNQKKEGLRLVCNPLIKNSLKEFATPSRVTLLIGPEGGLTTEEIKQTEKAGFEGLSLGPRILRTETAAVVALTLLQSQFGDLN